jgi:hypothetical protein
VFDEFFSVQRDRVAQLRQMLSADSGASINRPLLTAVSYTQLATYSVRDLQNAGAAMLRERFAAAEAALQDQSDRIAELSRQLDVLREHPSIPPVGLLFGDVVKTQLAVDNARAELWTGNYRLWEAIHNTWMLHCLNVYVRTFKGSAMDGLGDKLKEAAQDAAITTAEAFAEATFVPLLARVVRIFAGLRPPLLAKYPDAAAWHRELDSYTAATLDYAVLVDLFIQVAEVAGTADAPIDAEAWEPADPWPRVLARHERMLDELQSEASEA